MKQPAKTRTAKTRTAKTRTVLVKCLIVDSDGFPVNGHGEALTGKQKPFYTWEKQRRSTAWLQKYPLLWREVRA